MANRTRWDIFCRVVDNLGDAGVCWRLSRQLVAEYGLPVRLWIDDLASLKLLLPTIDISLQQQRVEGVVIACWQTDFEKVAPGSVVVEAFACELPEVYVQAMAHAASQPVWINLEYLSAEPWIKGCHGLASPHPSLPLTKYFYFPGFETDTGGLIRERELFRARDDFSRQSDDRASFLQSLGLGPPQAAERRISLFCYDHGPLAPLFRAWSSSSGVTRCLVPPGKPLAAVRRHFGDQGSKWTIDQLTVEAIPFLDQDDYDRLLWSCDLNFVRGEDSFVRAQWAGKPMVWHIYPQEEDAHLEKLQAFIECSKMPPAQAQFMLAWNTGVDVASAWTKWESAIEASSRHATAWAARLGQQTDLARGLVSFASTLL